MTITDAHKLVHSYTRMRSALSQTYGIYVQWSIERLWNARYGGSLHAGKDLMAIQLALGIPGGKRRTNY